MNFSTQTLDSDELEEDEFVPLQNNVSYNTTATAAEEEDDLDRLLRGRVQDISDLNRR